MAQSRLFPEIESPDFIRDEAIAAVAKEVLSAHGKVGGPVFEVAKAIRDDEVNLLWLRNDKPFDELNEDLNHDTAGKCIKAPGVWHDVTGFDVAIWLRGYWWDRWDAHVCQAAVLHELLHVEIKRTKNGQAKVAIRKHDVEDFVAVAKLYGPIFGEAGAYVRAATVRPAEKRHEPCPFAGCFLDADHAGDHEFNEGGEA